MNGVASRSEETGRLSSYSLVSYNTSSGVHPMMSSAFMSQPLQLRRRIDVTGTTGERYYGTAWRVCPVVHLVMRQ